MPSGGEKVANTQVTQADQQFQALLQMAGLYNTPAGAALMALLQNGNGMENLQGVLDALGNFNTQSLPGFMNRGFNLPPELQPFLNGLQGGMDSANNIVANNGRTPQSSYLWDRLSDMMTHGLPEVDATARGVLERGGWTPQSAGLNEQAQGLMAHGGFTAPLMDLQRAGMGLVGSQGQTAESREALNQFLNTIRGGGQDDQTRGMFSTGQGMIDRGGMTPDMQALMGQIMGGMQKGGMTPEASRIFNAAMGIVDSGGEGGALLPQDQMVTMAREASNTAMQQKANAARREFNARTGDALGAGTAGQALASFSDQAAQAESSAIRESILGRQEQKLKQLLGSMGVAGDVSGAAQQLMGQLAGAGADVSRSAASNIGTGAGLMSNAGQIAADRYKTGTAGFNTTLGQETDRMQVGNAMALGANESAFRRLGLGMDTSTRLNTVADAQTMNALNTLLSSGQLQLGAGSEMARLFNTESANTINALGALQGFAGTGLNAGMQQQGIDLQAATTSLQQQLASLGLSTEISQQIASQYLGGINGMLNLGGQYNNLGNTALNGRYNMSGQLINAAMQPSFWQQLAMAGVQAGTGMIGGGIASNGLSGLLGGLWRGNNGAVSGNQAWNLPGGPG